MPPSPTDQLAGDTLLIEAHPDAREDATATVPHVLFYSPGACSLAVHIVLEETGAPYVLDLRRTKSAEGAGSPGYATLNSKRRVPALSGVVGRSVGADGILTEGPAILQFLARTYPAAELLPGDPAGQARCAEWLNWLSADLHACGYGGLWRPDRFVHDPALYPQIEARARDTIRDRHDEIEAIFADGREWALPGGFSIADAFLLVFWRWGTRIGLNMGEWPRWSAVMAHGMERRSVQSALANGHS